MELVEILRRIQLPRSSGGSIPAEPIPHLSFINITSNNIRGVLRVNLTSKTGKLLGGGLSCLFASSLVIAQALSFPKGEFPLTNFKNHSVTPEEILSGGPPRDGIPAIDSPEFVSVSDAGKWLDDVEPVIAFQTGDHARAYPLQIMMYHEIVNDVVGGLPVLVTFCPLCNASIVFQRTVGDQVLDFGTTGRLRNSDLIMYDRQTESWWQQFTGKGIIGQYNGVRLEPMSSQIVSFREFANAFPDGHVLSRETGHQRAYGQNPYRGYDDINSNPFLFSGDLDPRLPPMERVLSVGMKSKTQLIPLTTLMNRPVVNVQINDQPVAVFATTTAASALDRSSISDSRKIPAAAAFSRKAGNRTLSFDWKNGHIRDDQTGSQWNPFGLATEGTLVGTQLEQVDGGVHFAFAWLAFDPGASIVTLP